MELLTDDVKEELVKLMEDGLQFVNKPEEVVCSNCGDIPLFHYIYPCSHPYCRDCYVAFQGRNKKCKVCRKEIGTKMLQSKKLEATIYKLKAICPNKLFGCNDEIELSRLLDHLLESKFTKDKQLPKLYNEKRDTSDEDYTDRKDLKESIENINITISNLSKQSEQVLKENNRLTESNAELNVTVQKLIGDVKILTGSNESQDRKIAELTERIEENKNDFKEKSSLMSKDVELVDQKVQKLSYIVTEIEPSIKRKVAGDVTDLNKSINESKQLLVDFKETNRKILVKNDKLIDENQKTLDENKSLAINKELAFDNSKSISLIEKLFEDNKNTTALNERCMNDYKNLKIDCDQLIQIKNYEVNEKVNRQEENIKTEVVNATRRLETIQKDGNRNTQKIEAVNKNVTILATLIDASVNDIVHIRQSQKDSMDAITAMKVPKNGVLIWEINEFSKKKMASTLADGVINYYSDKFYSSEYGYKIKLNVKFDIDELGVFLRFVTGEHDSHLPAVFHHKTTFYILDQSDRKEKRNVVIVGEPRFRDGQPEIWMKEYNGYPNFCTYSLLETKHKDVYLKNDRIFLKVVVEPIFPLTRNPYSNDGILMWKVLNYARTKQESQDEICEDFHSDSFYSSTHGYRMKCYLYFNKNQLDLWLFFLEGEFDDSLPDVYAHKVTFSILDQNDNSGNNNLNKVQTLDPNLIGNEKEKEKISAFSCSGVGFSFADFEKTPFLENDFILIKVKVKPI